MEKQMLLKLLFLRDIFWYLFIVFIDFLAIKGTLMQILRSPYMFEFIKKQYPENFTFWILRIIELFPREVCKILKK